MSPAELHTPVPSSSTAAAPLPLEPEAPQSEGPIAVFTKEQQKFAVSLLRTLKKHRSAPPFLRPVDPVALLIPDYFRVVTHPMDLGTVESKLGQTGKAMALAQKTGRIYGVDYGGLGAWEGKTHDVYRTAEEFREDVERVWENCFKYNGPKEKNPVSAMAGALQDVYERLWRNMPQAPAVEVSFAFLLSLLGPEFVLIVSLRCASTSPSLLAFLLPRTSRRNAEFVPPPSPLPPLTELTPVAPLSPRPLSSPRSVAPKTVPARSARSTRLRASSPTRTSRAARGRARAGMGA